MFLDHWRSSKEVVVSGSRSTPRRASGSRVDRFWECSDHVRARTTFSTNSREQSWSLNPDCGTSRLSERAHLGRRRPRVEPAWPAWNQSVSSSARSHARSLRFARRIATAMNGAASFEKLAGSPRLRSVMSRATIARRRPGVGGFHREWPISGAHDEAFVGDEVDELVGVGESPAKELRDEGDLGSDRGGRGRLPLHCLDVDVPVGCVRGVRRVRRDHLQRSSDDDLGLDVDGHCGIPGRRGASADATAAGRRSPTK